MDRATASGAVNTRSTRVGGGLRVIIIIIKDEYRRIMAESIE